MQIKLSVLLLVLAFIFVMFHYYGKDNNKVNPPPYVHSQYEMYSPQVDMTPVYSDIDNVYGTPEAGFTAISDGQDQIIYSDGTPFEEVTPLY